MYPVLALSLSYHLTACGYPVIRLPEQLNQFFFFSALFQNTKHSIYRQLECVYSFHHRLGRTIERLLCLLSN